MRAPDPKRGLAITTAAVLLALVVALLAHGDLTPTGRVISVDRHGNVTD